MTDEQTWRKSRFSGSQANCIEVGNGARVVLVRDTKDRNGGTLAFAAEAWRAFMASVKRG